MRCCFQFFLKRSSSSKTNSSVRYSKMATHTSLSVSLKIQETLSFTRLTCSFQDSQHIPSNIMKS